MADGIGGGTFGAAGEHWFAGKDLDVLIYKVNRRPTSADPTLFEPPPNTPEHLARMLRSLHAPVKSGRRHQRFWRVGNLDVDEASGTLTGVFGWSRSGSVMSNVWDQDAQEWRDQVVPSEESGVAPFAYVPEMRFLGVLRHPGFTEQTVQWVFTQMLNRAERQTGMPAVDWAVEPVGDAREFNEWLDSAERVTELKFVFERPNPDAEEEFVELFDRIDRLHAEKIQEKVTARDKAVGLDRQGLRQDKTSRAFIAAAMAAFGFVVGTAYRGGKKVVYDQRNQGLRSPITGVAPDWPSATAQVEQAVRHVTQERMGRDG